MKKQFTFTAILASIFTVITVNSLKAQSEAIKYYFGNNCADSSGGGYHGTGNNITYTTDIAGLPNSAGSFNGTSSYVEVPNTWIGGYAIGVSIWFKTNNHDAPSGFVYGGLESVGNTPSNFTPLLYMDSAGHVCGFFYDGGSDELVSTDTLNDNKWHHVVFHVRVQQVTGEVHQEIWVDGKMNQSRDQGFNGGGNSYAHIYVGTCNGRNMYPSYLPDVWEYLDGTMDNVIFFLGGAGPEYYHHLDLLITEHPQSQTKTIGQPATMHISHTYFNPDSTYTYQWKKNGININGAIDSVYTIPAVAMSDAGSYTCTVQTIDSYQVSSIAGVLTVSAVDVKNVAGPNGYKLYPNPANDVLNLEFENTNNTGAVQVLSMDGRILIDQLINNNLVNTSGLATGMYMLRVNDGKNISNTFFMKQ